VILCMYTVISTGVVSWLMLRANVPGGGLKDKMYLFSLGTNFKQPKIELLNQYMLSTLGGNGDGGSMADSGQVSESSCSLV